MSISKLILVPCHSIWKGSNDGSNAEDWHLAPFQHEGHDHLYFIEHIKKSLAICDPESLVVFSGGQTKKDAGCLSEAQSYYMLASKLNLLENKNVTTEEFALDSFENLLFAICRFKELLGDYPLKITVVGFEFKRHRFTEQHARMIGWTKQFEYIGINPSPPYEVGGEQWNAYFEDLATCEQRFATEPFSADGFGCSDTLYLKKQSRNPFNRNNGYLTTNHLLSSLLLVRERIGNDSADEYFEKYIHNKVPY